MTENNAAQPGLNDTIRAVFLEHGFTIKHGQTDLKPYVYEAVHALLSKLRDPVADESPMAKMADALREKGRQEQQAYQDRRNKATEWGPMPDGTEADSAHVADERELPTLPVAWGSAINDAGDGHVDLYSAEQMQEYARAALATGERQAVAYLDLGAGGYMDVGTDLTDEQLAALPKGRHMLAIIGTHGVNGYTLASAPVAGDAQEPVAYRAWFDQDNGARWLFTLWPEEERLDVQWEPLYAAPQPSPVAGEAQPGYALVPIEPTKE